MIRSLLIPAALVLALPAAAAGLEVRPAVEVSGPTVRLGDVLEDAGDAADRPIAQSPAPGETMSLAMADIARAAREAGLDDLPTLSGYVRVARASQAVPETAVLALLEDAISGRAYGERFRLRITGQRGSLHVPVDADPLAITLETMRLDEATGRFAARLLLPADGGLGTAVELSGIAERLREVPVLLRDMERGEIVSARDVGTAAIVARKVNRGTISDISMLVGKETRRSLRANEPLREGDVEAPVLVARGAIVTVSIARGGMSLSTTAKAMQEGTEGDVIRLINLATNRALEGRVVGPDRVAALAPFALTSAR
ncbi:MAG: hypothetical protein Tsb008_14620 [Rhodothalassiaceae bacterium]